MAFVKGQSGNPAGKLPGTKHVKTVDFRNAVQMLIDKRGPDLDKWIGRIATKNPARAVECIVALAEFSTPKLSRVTHTGDVDAPVFFSQVKDDIPDAPVSPTNETDQ